LLHNQALPPCPRPNAFVNAIVGEAVLIVSIEVTSPIGLVPPVPLVTTPAALVRVVPPTDLDMETAAVENVMCFIPKEAQVDTDEKAKPPIPIANATNCRTKVSLYYL